MPKFFYVKNTQRLLCVLTMSLMTLTSFSFSQQVILASPETLFGAICSPLSCTSCQFVLVTQTQMSLNYLEEENFLVDTLHALKCSKSGSVSLENYLRRHALRPAGLAGAPLG